jgi:hypothetical protein
MSRGVIEVAPLAYIAPHLEPRLCDSGRSQNPTPEQMLMFLTRLGFDSKCVITGDLTQIDLPPNRASIEGSAKHAAGIDGISITELTDRDVVRHALVQKVIQAYRRGRTKTNSKRIEAYGHKWFSIRSGSVRAKSKRRDRRRAQTRPPINGSDLFAFLIWATAMVLLLTGGVPRYPIWPSGRRPPPRCGRGRFECLDTAQTELNRRQVIDKVLPVFTTTSVLMEPPPENWTSSSIESRISVGWRRNRPMAATWPAIMGDVLDLLDLPLTPDEALSLAPEGGRNGLDRGAQRAANRLERGIVSEMDRATLFQREALTGELILANPDDNKNLTVTVPSLRSPEQARTRGRLTWSLRPKARCRKPTWSTADANDAPQPGLRRPNHPGPPDTAAKSLGRRDPGFAPAPPMRIASASRRKSSKCCRPRKTPAGTGTPGTAG